MLTKRELGNLWREYGFRPSRRLGQNYLIDRNIRDKILSSLKIKSADTVMEIGSGFAEMTRGLAAMAGRVYAVEKDPRSLDILEKLHPMPENVTLVREDFLKLDFAKLTGGRKVAVYGNLPYCITTPIIEKLCGNIDLIKDIYLVVQKEVAQRIAARPGSKAMGRLSLYAQYYADPEFLFRISKGCFFPEPEVESAFLRLLPRAEKVRLKDENLFFSIIKKAYGKRRKTILNALCERPGRKHDLENLLREAKIDPKARPEELSLEDFARLADRWPATWPTVSTRVLP